METSEDQTPTLSDAARAHLLRIALGGTLKWSQQAGKFRYPIDGEDVSGLEITELSQAGLLERIPLSEKGNPTPILLSQKGKAVAAALTPFAGTPCEFCGAPLRVVEINPTMAQRTPDGELMHHAAYECEGSERHGFATACSLGDGIMRAPVLLPRKILPLPPTLS